MVNFVKLARVAQRLVEANGRAVDLFRVNRDPDNAGEPWRGTSVAPDVGQDGEVIGSVIMAFVPATGGGFGKLILDKPGELKEAYQQVGLLATDSLPTGVTTEDVESADSLRDGDDIWKIVRSGHLRPGAVSLLFVLGLSK